VAVPYPIRLDRLFAGLKLVLAAALGAVVVKQAGEPWPRERAGAFVSMRLVDGPTARGLRDSVERLRVPTGLTVTIGTATPNERYIVGLNGYDHRVDASGVDTVDTLRDTLVADIAADTLGGVAAVATATPGQLTLTPATLGRIVSWRIRPPALVSVVVDGTAPAKLWTAQRRVTIELSCFAASGGQDEGAASMVGQIEAALQSDANVGTLARYGVGVSRVGTPVYRPTTSGADFESASALELTCLVRSRIVESLAPIQSVADPTVTYL